MAHSFNHIKFALFYRSNLSYLWPFLSNKRVEKKYYRLIITRNKFFSDSILYFYNDYKESVTFACSWSFRRTLMTKRRYVPLLS